MCEACRAAERYSAEAASLRQQADKQDARQSGDCENSIGNTVTKVVAETAVKLALGALIGVPLGS